MGYSVTHKRNIAELSKDVDIFLHTHPVINFEAIGILEQLRENPQTFEGELECMIVSESGQIQVVSCRIRPFNLLISHSVNIKSLYPLVEYFQHENISIPGVFGPSEEVKNFANIWMDMSGENFKTSSDFFQYSMTTKKRISQPMGEISTAKSEHKKLLEGWTKRSIREIVPQSTDEFVDSCTNSFLKLLEQNKVFILEAGNVPVSMAAISGQTTTMLALNDVYTPPKAPVTT